MRIVVVRFMIPGLVALLALAVGILLVLRPLGERRAVDEVRSLAILAAAWSSPPSPTRRWTATRWLWRSSTA